ncbi:MAG: DUF2062 domain-containing protein, partial [Gammaproteobacteria bacterium]|nr:DUF2062 domain-containing protein [Gammaproteobacteria bacterium]
SVEWLKTEMLAIWKPFLTGCFSLAIISSFLGFIGVRLLWRLSIIRYLENKKLRQKLKKD